MIDPLADWDIDIQSFDIPRMVSVYPDRFGIRWFTKAWFNNSESGEAAIEIERQIAVNFIRDLVEKDEWDVRDEQVKFLYLSMLQHLAEISPPFY